MKFRLPAFLLILRVGSRSVSLRRFLVLAAALTLLVLTGACAVPRRVDGTFDRPFQPGRDTFAYSNELFWVYQTNLATGTMEHHWRDPKPTYAQHCFVVARSARQFFQQARFDPSMPATDEATYRGLVRKVITADPRREPGATNKVIVPGFADLHEFSRAYEGLLKRECGTMWHSYTQRGHWRMIFPFSRSHQRRTERALVDSLGRNRPPVVHVAHFPRLQINHALLLYGERKTAEGREFVAYDPNYPHTPARLLFREADGRFYFPPQSYFPGGVVDVYEVYHRWNY